VNATQLLAHFDRISEAPDAVSRLRRFILDLAVRGRVAEQNSVDESAAELVPRIHAAKRQFTGRPAKPVPKIDEEPFAIPSGWAWVRIREVTSDRGQLIPEAEFTYIDVTAIDKENGRIAETRVLSPSEAPSRARKRVAVGDILYSCVRPYLLNVAVVETEIAPAPIASTAFAVLNTFGLILPRYLWMALRSPFMIACVDKKMRGQAYPAINDADFARLPVPLPPLAEQDRIVKKVDDLMKLCDCLEAAQKGRERRRDQLVSASLNRLNAPSDDGSGFREDARFHLRHLPRLITRTDHLVDLRQTLLRLLVTGRMIRRHRDSSRSHREFPSTPLYPAHWVLAPLSEVAAQIVDCPHSTPKWEAAGKICVRTNQFRPGYLDLKDSRYVSNATYEERIDRLRPIRDDILYSREGGILGVACRIPPNVDLCLGQRMLLIRAGEQIAPAFLELVLNSPVITDIARRETTGGAAPRVNVSTVRAYPIPVPPLSEQLEIVSTFQNLMSLCDRLEARLTATQTESRRFLESTLHEALRAPREIAAPA
jgi:type I restriction enzyme S subunit